MFLGGIVCGFIVGLLFAVFWILIDEGYFPYLWSVLRSKD